MSRRSEIEAKRAKIAELQRLREQRQAAAGSNVSTTLRPATSAGKDKETIDSLVDSLLAGRIGSPDSEGVSSERADTRDAKQAAAPVTPVQFDTVIIDVFDVAPAPQQETVTYSKGVQTTEPWEYLQPPSTPTRDTQESRQLHSPQNQDRDENRTIDQSHTGIQTHTTQSCTQQTSFPSPPPRITVKSFGKEELEELQKNTEYTHFIDQSLKVISRALQPDYDILTDYGAASTQETKGDQLISQTNQLYSDHSKGRAVTFLDWSPRYPELIASAHTEKNSDSNASRGLVQIWNLNMPTWPEYVLNANTNVLAVCFSPFESNLVFGTGYNGQVISWDLRAGSHPILVSPLTGTGHTHPTFCLSISGTQNANNLITASTDGVVCTWTPDILVKPQDRLVLESPFASRVEDVAPTALAVSPRDPTLFLVGTEKGSILQCNKFSQAGLKAGIDPRGYYKGHLSPVTSMDFHPSRGPLDMGNYMLTSGLDWSIKLWKMRPFTGAVPTTASLHSWNSISTATAYEAILDLKRDDSVYDVAWNPNHPSIFASVDGQGYLEVWDLAKDFEVPILREKPLVEGAVDGASTYLNHPLNRLCWEPNGTKIAVGGLDGIVSVFELAPDFVISPSVEEWTMFKRRLKQLEEAS